MLTKFVSIEKSIPFNSYTMDINNIMTSLEAKHPGEKEYLQAVKEVLMSVEEVYNQHPEFEKARIIERMV